MTDVLILGGTGWLSGAVARRWVGAGARVTCLARGGRPAPDGAHLVIADRADADAYAAVAGREWDEVVDISSRAGHVAAAVAALGAAAHHWTYVSSLSVYAADDVTGADETAPVHLPAAAGDEYDYGREKSAAEAALRRALEDRAAIIRPGLIVGPGDPTDRFGYWVGRFACAGAEPVLVPDAADARAQVIDVDDLADFVVTVGRAGWHGTANATGESIPLDALLDRARTIAGHSGRLVRAAPAWLEAQEVAYWMGPRSLPLWLPADMPGFATRSIEAFRAAGGVLRPLDETLVRTLADERARGLDRDRATGLTRAEELALIAQLV